MSEHQRDMHDQTDETQTPGQEGGPSEQPTCANCGHLIEPDDIVCPNCGISLVAG